MGEMLFAAVAGALFFLWVMKPLHDGLWDIAIQRRDLEQFARAHPTSIAEETDKSGRPVRTPNRALDLLQ